MSMELSEKGEAFLNILKKKEKDSVIVGPVDTVDYATVHRNIHMRKNATTYTPTTVEKSSSD